jgi:uncharacterized repeat protein (TIGR01451 family)
MDKFAGQSATLLPELSMKPWSKLLRAWALRPVLLTLLLLPLPGFAPSRTGGDPGYRLQVLHADETGVTLELHLTGFTLAEREHQGATYQVVTVPGLAPMTAAGQPQVPALARLLGTPPAGVAEIKILAAESETLSGVRLFPTPALYVSETEGTVVETFALDAALYATDAPFPGALTEVGQTGHLRDQPFAQVRLYPFQYNPLRQELEVYRRLRVQMRFSPPAGPQANPSSPRSDTPYEHLLENLLLNYAALPSTPPLPRPTQPTTMSPANSSPALKIFVDQDALYRIAYDDLQSAGFNLAGVDPRHLRLHNGGREVAITISGEVDGVFDPDDWLEFYGAAAVSEFTTRNVYWLTVDDDPGLRMAERDATPTGASASPTAFYTRLHREKNHWYWSQLPPAAGQDHWFWTRFSSAPYSQDYGFNVRYRADIAADSQVRVALVGRTSTEQDPDHHSQILLNGELIDEAWWDGQIAFTHEIVIPQQRLLNGNNTLTVATPGDTGASVDSLYVNWFEIDYWDTYTARDSPLYFTAPQTGQTTFTLSHFYDDDIEVYDISDPFQPTRLINGLIEATGDEYRLQIQDDVPAEARYLALTGSQKQTPAGLLLDAPSSWRSPDNGADYIVITHEDFGQAIAPLVDYHAAQGLRVVTVGITDVYDEFNSGVFDPQAIRDFLDYAYHHWTPPAPLYVLLVGDANYDYQDYLDTGRKNYVPTHLFESPSIGQTSSDNWFVSVSGDDPLPDMFIGRLPVQTPAQASLLVNKALTYEQNPPPGDWRQKTLFIAGADQDDVFEIISDELIAALPANYTAQRMYPTAYPYAYDPTPDIIAAINRGTSIVNHVGHGSVNGLGQWPGGETIFLVEDIAQLQNGSIYPFLAVGNCYGGLFSYPRDETFAEEFVRHQNGGGVAAFSPTGIGYAYWHEATLRALYETFFDDRIYRLGPATTAARIAAFTQTGWSEPVETFTLLGDPALALQVAQPGLRLSKTTAVSLIRPGQLLTYTLAYANTSQAIVENVVLTETYDAHTAYYAAHPPPTQSDNVWQINALPVGASGTITLTVRVSETASAGAELVNLAALSGDGAGLVQATVHTAIEWKSIYLPLVHK